MFSSRILFNSEKATEPPILNGVKADEAAPRFQIVRPDDNRNHADNRSHAGGADQSPKRNSSTEFHTKQNGEESGLVWTEELGEELSATNEKLESESPESILSWASERFGKRLTFATAFGPEGMVVLHLISKLGLDIHCFNLDTGYQFQETLELRDKVLQQIGIDVELRRPQQTVEEFEKENGQLYLTDPNRCCFERKIKVLHEAIKGRHGWVSAIRRDQSPDRAVAPIIGWDQKFNLVKVNPLANLDKSAIWKTILDNNIPYNPLHDQGYPSIGCQPCTRPVQIGEDERAGRWSGSQKTECGLHSENP